MNWVFGTEVRNAYVRSSGASIKMQGGREPPAIPAERRGIVSRVKVCPLPPDLLPPDLGLPARLLNTVRPQIELAIGLHMI
jgi:hypothetical protein